MIMRIVNFLIEHVLAVIWAIALVGYIIFQIQWKRGKINIRWGKK